MTAGGEGGFEPPEKISSGDPACSSTITWSSSDVSFPPRRVFGFFGNARACVVV
ncbi:MAG: hypothetical protein M3188_04165 [Actinomycetota bacterium]|nr:hypothetical protein [Actinomycetota bacterium]